MPRRMPRFVRNVYPQSVRIDEEQAQTYAWNWFALHAGQRLQLVNFWWVAIAFFATAFVQAISAHLIAVAVGVSLAGAIASFGFIRLDNRTRQLIQTGEAALRHLEASRSDEYLELVKISQQAQTSRLDSYRLIIQGMQLLVAVLFVLGTAYTAVFV